MLNSNLNYEETNKATEGNHLCRTYRVYCIANLDTFFEASALAGNSIWNHYCYLD